MVDLDKTLFEAEEALKRAEEVRLVAIHAVDKAREAIKLKAAGVAAEKLLHAAEIAAAAILAAELKALHAWEEAATRTIERRMNTRTGQ